jgi:hypothetical protein
MGHAKKCDLFLLFLQPPGTLFTLVIVRLKSMIVGLSLSLSLSRRERPREGVKSG